MKDLFKILSVAAVALLVSALPSLAQTPVSLPFFTGYNLAVTATSTNTYSGTNIYARGYTVTNTTTYPYVSGYSPTLHTNTAAFGDVTLWANRDGTAPSANISVQFSGLNAAFTNTAALTFVSIPAASTSSDYPAGLLQPATETQNKFTFSITGNGTNIVNLATNVPTAFLQGCKGVRCSQIIWSNAGTNGTVAGIFLNGFKPVNP